MNGLSWRRGAFTLSIATGSGFVMSREDALSLLRLRLQQFPQPWPSVSLRHRQSSLVQWL
jgi:hypothetical protein